MPGETSPEEPIVEPAGEASASARPVPDSTDAAPGPASDATTPGGYSYTIVDDTAETANAAPAGGRPRGMQALALAGVAIVAAVLAGGAVWLLASGGGSSSSRVGADVSNVLNAFSQGQDGTVTTRFEGELPPGFPNAVPIYPGARVVSGLQQVKGEDVGYIVVWDTDDARDKVAADFNTRFSADPWQIDGGQDARESTVHQFSKIDDPNITGLVLVAESKGDKTTTILESVQVTAGAKDAKTQPFTTIGSRTVPDGFPDSLPAYDGAVITQSAYKKQASGKSYALSYITKDGASPVLDYYRGKLSDAKLTVTDGDASTSTLEDAQAIDFTDAAKSMQGQIVVGKFAEDAGYTQIDLSLLVTKPSATSAP